MEAGGTRHIRITGEVLARMPDADLLTVEGQQPLIVLNGDLDHLVRRRIGDRHALERGADLADEPGPADGRTPDHRRAVACGIQSASGSIERVYVAVRDDGNV